MFWLFVVPSVLKWSVQPQVRLSDSYINSLYRAVKSDKARIA